MISPLQRSATASAAVLTRRICSRDRRGGAARPAPQPRMVNWPSFRQDGGKRDGAEPRRRVLQEARLEPDALGGADEVAAGGSRRAEPEIMGKLERVDRDAIVAGDHGERLSPESMRSAGAICGRELGLDLSSKERASSAGRRRFYRNPHPTSTATARAGVPSHMEQAAHSDPRNTSPERGGALLDFA